MKNMYIDDLQIHDYQDVSIGYSIRDAEGLSFPEVRTSSYERSGEHGDYLANTLYSGRLITLSGTITGNTLSEYNQRRRTLQKYFSFKKDEYGHPIKRTLKFTTMDDLALQVNVVTKSPIRMSQRNILSTFYQVDVYSPDFYLESQEETVIELLVPFGGGFVLPFILPVTFDTKIGGYTIIQNNGTTQSYPTIQLNGSLTHPVLYNETINKYIDLDYDIAIDDTPVIIDNRNKTIKQGSTPILSARTLGSSWLWLESDENVISITTNDSGDDGSVQISYRHNYLGV